MPAVVQTILGWIVMGFFVLMLVSVVSLVRMMQAPVAPTFARRRATGPSTDQVRRDHNADFRYDHGGFLFRRRFYLRWHGLPAGATQ